MKNVEKGVVTRAVVELERLFHAANERFFLSQLPLPVISIQSQGKRKTTAGWCTTAPIWKSENNEKQQYYEIVLTAEFLDRGVYGAAGTLLHEMSHLWNLTKGVSDCSVNQYHNQKFRRAAERAGLKVEESEKHGWSKTSLLPQTKEWVDSLKLDEAAFQFARSPINYGGKNKMLKWSCGCTTVRCAVQLRATCEKCGNFFELQD